MSAGEQGTKKEKNSEHEMSYGMLWWMALYSIEQHFYLDLFISENQTKRSSAHNFL